MVRCGIIGCGQVAEEMHLPALRALNVSVEMICEADPVRLRRFGETYGIGKTFTDVDAFIADSSPLDFVVIATPGFTHYEIAKKVVAAGKHLLVEKPLALTLKEVLDLKGQVETKGVKLCIAQTWRFRASVLQATTDRDGGLIGKIYQVNSVHHGSSLFHASEPSWRWKERQNKTFLYEYAIHLLDLQVYFAGPVAKILGVKVKRDPALDATTHVYGLIEHDSGTVAWVDAQLFASSNYTHFELFGTANDVQIKFFPEAYRLYSGRIHPLDEIFCDLARAKDFAFSLVAGRLGRQAVPRRALPHFRLYQRFVVALEKNLTVPVTIEDVLPTMEYLELLGNAVYSE